LNKKKYDDRNDSDSEEGHKKFKSRRKSSDGSIEDDKKDKKSDDGQGKMEIFVKNLSYTTDEKALEKFFGTYGNVTRVKILTREDGKSKGIGFVAFEVATEAQAAMDDAENLNLDGRKVFVNWANEKKRKRWQRW